MRGSIFRLVDMRPGVRHYAPVIPVFIHAINEDGKIELKQIEDFSVHGNTPVFEISHDSFGSFKATVDHSLLVYDKNENKIRPITPTELIELKKSGKADNLYFVKSDDPQNNQISYIPVKDIDIRAAGFQTTYDFTVKDFQTFMLDNGIFVQDTIAVYMPLTIEAQKEAKEKMFRKTRSIATGEILFELAQGMILGLYLLTKEGKPSKTLSYRPSSYDYDTLIKFIEEDPNFAYLDMIYKGPKSERPIKTTLGRILVNSVLPPQMPFFDKVLNKKNIKELFFYMNKFLKDDEILDTYDKLRKLGFDAVTRFGISMPITEMVIPLDLKKLAEKLKDMDPETGMKYIEKELMPKLKQYVKEHYPQIYAIFDSGARGSWSDLMQMVLVKGYVEDAEGKVVKVPVAKGFLDNLNAVEAFIISPTARAGIANRSIRTAEGGYLTRRLVKAAANIKIDFKTKDCGTNRYLEIPIEDEDWAKAIIGRYLHDGTLVTDENYKSFIGKTVKLRSPIFCKTPKICLTCYGELHKLLTSDDIGIQSAQIVGERGTQLIMKTFHTGGLAETSGIPQIIDDNSPNISQQKMNIIIHKPCTIRIEKDSANYNVYEDRVLLKEGLALVTFNDGTYYEIDIQDPSYALTFINFIDLKSDEDKVVLKYDVPNQIIAEIELMSSGMASTLQIVNKLFERRLCKDCDISKTLIEIFRHYKSTGRKLIHFEIVLSNMVRSKKNLYLPYRLSNDSEYTILGISQVPFYTSPLLALAFQNIGKAIETGLLFPDDITPQESDFEKILLGKF